jgi:hypothetical protein
MKTKTVFLTVFIAAFLAIVVSPAVVNNVFADPAPKQDPSCSDPKFEERDSCPGKSEDSSGDKRDDECTARNRGQADEDCNDDIVNPPN